MLWTQKNPLDSRRFLAIRSCVDLPEPSEPSTIIRVPGRSSAEKNISFSGREVFLFVHADMMLGEVLDFFEELDVDIGEYYLSNILNNPSRVKKNHIF